MKIPIKNLNEVKTPNNGVLLFVDVEDSKLKGKKSNNEILNFSSNSNSSMKFYKCASVNIPQVSTGTGKPTYIISNASLDGEINGTYTYLGEFNDPSHSSTCLLWKNTKDNGRYIYSGDEGWWITSAAAFDDGSGFTPYVPPTYVIVQNVDGTDISEYSDEYAGKGTFAPVHALTELSDGVIMTYANAEPETPSEPEASKTWTGYELVLTDGKYTVSSEITTGLAYTTMTPTVNYIYSEDALIRVGLYYSGLPTDGLVFYASLAGSSGTAETGQVFTANGTVEYSVQNAIPCMRVDNYTGHFADTNMPSGNASRTFSCWVKRDEQSSGGEATFFAYGTGSHGQSVDFCYVGNYLGVDNYHGQISDGVYISQTVWHHVLFTYDKETNIVSFYVDGIKTGYSTWSRVPDTVLSGTVYIGRGVSGDYSFGQGYIAACRVYNRVLTQDEITTLANEFTPTVAPEEGSDSGSSSSSDNAIAVIGKKFHLLAEELFYDANFTIADTTATGSSRTWVGDNENGHLFIAYDSSMGWYMKNSKYDSVVCLTNGPSLENPWDTTTWYYYGPGGEDLIFTLVEITITE